jgi:hypothetical protein
MRAHNHPIGSNRSPASVQTEYQSLDVGCASEISETGCPPAGDGLTACLSNYMIQKPRFVVSPTCNAGLWSFWTATLTPSQITSTYPYLYNPVQHIIVIVQENHSFDADFGSLNQSAYTGAPGTSTAVNGISPSNANPARLCNGTVAQHPLNTLVPSGGPRSRPQLERITY